MLQHQQQKKKNLKPQLPLKSTAVLESPQVPIGNILKDLDKEVKKAKAKEKAKKKFKNFSLPKRFKNSWVKALRSGKYKKVNGALAEKKIVKVEGEEQQQWQYCVLGMEN